MTDYIEISNRTIWIGIIAGVVASLYLLFPVILPGFPNLWYATGILGIFLVWGSLQDERFQGFVIAAGVFLIISFAVYPAVTNFLVDQGGPVQKTENTEVVTLSVPDMFCQGCVYSVRDALKGIDGVKQVKVSLSEKEAVVSYNPKKTSPEEMVQNRVVEGYGGSIKETS